jgi:hypothetical protein
MQFSTIAVASAFAAIVAANGNHTATPSAVWVTDVVTSFTTVCPVATSFSFNGVTYTATEVNISLLRSWQEFSVQRVDLINLPTQPD